MTSFRPTGEESPPAKNGQGPDVTLPRKVVEQLMEKVKSLTSELEDTKATVDVLSERLNRATDAAEENATRVEDAEREATRLTRDFDSEVEKFKEGYRETFPQGFAEGLHKANEELKAENAEVASGFQIYRTRAIGLMEGFKARAEAAEAALAVLKADKSAMDQRAEAAEAEVERLAYRNMNLQTGDAWDRATWYAGARQKIAKLRDLLIASEAREKALREAVERYLASACNPYDCVDEGHSSLRAALAGKKEGK